MVSNVFQSSLSKRLGIAAIGLVAGTMFAAPGVAVMVFTAKQHTLTCRRVEPPTNQGLCQLVRSGFLGDEVTEIPIREIHRADVQANQGDGSITYRVSLITERDIVPLREVWSSGRSPKQAIATQINEFIQNRDTADLVIVQDDRWFGYLFAGIFGGIGLGIATGVAIAAAKIPLQ